MGLTGDSPGRWRVWVEHVFVAGGCTSECMCVMQAFGAGVWRKFVAQGFGAGEKCRREAQVCIAVCNARVWHKRLM